MTGYKASGAVSSNTIISYKGSTALGVAEKTTMDPSIPGEIGYDPVSKKSEMLVFKSDDVISHAKFNLAEFYGPETTRFAAYKNLYEQGKWQAYDGAGKVVASGTFVASKTTGEHTVELDFGYSKGVQKIELSATEYVKTAAGAAWTRTDAVDKSTKMYHDSSDYLVTKVQICDYVTDEHCFEKGKWSDSTISFTSVNIKGVVSNSAVCNYKTTTVLGCNDKTSGYNTNTTEIGYDAKTKMSEQVIMKSKEAIASATFDLSEFYGPEYCGKISSAYKNLYEQGKWQAYDEDGVLVKSGTFVANANAGGKYTLDLNFDCSDSIHKVVLSATELVKAGGASWTRTDSTYKHSSDYQITKAQVETFKDCDDCDSGATSSHRELQENNPQLLIKQATAAATTTTSSTVCEVKIGDELFGNGGADRFIYNKGDGVDKIWDFNRADGDIIELRGFTQLELNTAIAKAAAEGHPDIVVLGTNMGIVSSGHHWVASDFLVA